ncbi:MAG TPA: hypothetical protein VF168_04185 [Trueperaceae bacterium]
MSQRTTDIRFEETLRAERVEPFPVAPGLFMALFLTGALLLAVTNSALLESPDEPLLDGSWAAAYQERFDEASPLFVPATTIWGAIDYILFDQGRAGVLVGEDGWLYSTEEFAYPAETDVAARRLDANLDAIAAVADRLQELDIDLVVALLPSKARIYPEHLGRYRLPKGPTQLYSLALAGLRDRGVPVTGLLPPLLEAKEEGAVFLRTDTHWTPYGAREAAEAVAETIRGIARFPWLDQEEYATTRSEPQPHRGDLTNFLPLGPLYDELGPEDDELIGFETSAAGAPDTDLFAQVEIPVVLVGTSYSQDERWNFAGWLRQALGSDVLVAAQRGEGPFEPMVEYLGGDAFRNAPPQVVVWEVPERYLSRRWQTGEGGE